MLATGYLAVLLVGQREDAESAHEQVSNVLESISDAFFTLDRQWRFTYVNHEAERQLRRPREQLLGRNIWEAFPEAVESESFQQYHRAMAESVPVAFEEFYPPLGKWFEVHAYPAQEGLSVYFQDIGERKRAEAEREEVLAELEATILAIPDAVMIFFPDGAIRRVNPAAERMVGFGPEEFARPIAERTATLRLERPDGSPLALEDSPAPRALRGETVIGMDMLVHPATGGTVWVSASAAPIYSSDGHLLGAILTMVDVTPLRHVIEQRDDFVRAVSHDLRQPLTIIQGQAQMLQIMMERGELVDQRQARSLEAIATSALRMNAMISDLVDSVRLEAGQITLRPEPLDLPDFVAKLKDRMAGSGEGERISIESSAGLPPVRADADKLERILTNLLSNALKYSPPASPVWVSLARADGEAVVEVRDQGPGIDPVDVPRLFERYFRAKAGLERRREGLGLGLYIVKGLVEAHGGRVWVESTPGKGSTFAFSLPEATSAKD
jgi:PAS domain S-box-containing protein